MKPVAPSHAIGHVPANAATVDSLDTPQHQYAKHCEERHVPEQNVHEHPPIPPRRALVPGLEVQEVGNDPHHHVEGDKHPIHGVNHALDGGVLELNNQHQQ